MILQALVKYYEELVQQEKQQSQAGARQKYHMR